MGVNNVGAQVADIMNQVETGKTLGKDTEGAFRSGLTIQHHKYHLTVFQ